MKKIDKQWSGLILPILTPIVAGLLQALLVDIITIQPYLLTAIIFTILIIILVTKQVFDTRAAQKKKLEIEKLTQSKKELEEKLKIYEENSFAATGIVLNKEYTKALLIYNKTQNRWVPPGSHVLGVQHVHKLVKESARRETGYSIKFHESHNHEEFDDANCCRVPCPFFVQVEKNIYGDKHKEHYDFLYILIADEFEHRTNGGNKSPQWFTVDTIDEFVNRGLTYPDVLNCVKCALQIVKRGGKK